MTKNEAKQIPTRDRLYVLMKYAMLSNYESCNWWWIYGFDNKGKLYIMPLKSTVL